jgi:hypothetical protein
VSIPHGPGQPERRPALEPTHVQRRRRSETLAELLSQVRENERGAADPDDGYESVVVPATTTRLLPPPEEDETQELPPIPGHGPGSGPGPGHGPGFGRGAGLRRAAVVVAVTAAALVGFALALLLPGGDKGDVPQSRARPTTTPAAQAPSRAADPDRAGTLREGDRGPAVTELQERLLRIPNVYDNGSTSGTYDATLTEAVARFQLWYGIRGDERGVYGDDTRADLESRTAL